MKDKNIGSSLDSRLKEEGIDEQVSANAAERVIARQSLSGIPPDLGDEAVRRRLGPAGWTAFRRIVGIWQVPEDEAGQLLGLPAGTSLDNLDPAQLSEDQMLHISCLIGIYKALHIVLPDALADIWATRPNDNAMFGGQVPLSYMANGGIEALWNVRRLLDAQCAGNF